MKKHCDPQRRNMREKEKFTDQTVKAHKAATKTPPKSMQSANRPEWASGKYHRGGKTDGSRNVSRSQTISRSNYTEWSSLSSSQLRTPRVCLTWEFVPLHDGIAPSSATCSVCSFTPLSLSLSLPPSLPTFFRLPSSPVNRSLSPSLTVFLFFLLSISLSFQALGSPSLSWLCFLSC